jgi:chromosome segregation ATPase
VSEDPTGELPGASPFEQRVLAELGALRSNVGALRSEVAEVRARQVAMAQNISALDQRLTSQEEKVDSRLQETRSIREAVRAQIEKLNEKFNIFIRDLYDVRGDIGLHDKRLNALERRILS